MPLVPDIEVFEIDKSFIEPPTSDGPGLYIALFSEKGPDNRIIKGYSPSNIINKFGKPNVEKYGYGLYYAIKAAEFTPNVFIVRLLPDDATYANSIIEFQNPDNPHSVAEDVQNSSEIKLDDVSGINVGDTVLVINQTNAGKQYLYLTVVNVDTDNKVITVNENVNVNSGSPVYVIQPIQVTSASGLNNDESLPDTNSPYTIIFYPIGRGEYYNNIVIKFERNTDLERRYTNEITGDVLYPYMFWNVYIFEKNPETGLLTLLEDPITVSLFETDNNGQPFLHPVTGQKLYIEEQINNISENIRVRVIQSNLNAPKQVYTGQFKLYIENIGDEIKLQSGSNGTLTEEQKTSLLLRAYNGTLNDDVEKITESSPIFKAYEIHYIPDPGYTLDVKGEMINLALRRKDCSVILSLPYSKKHLTDINIRTNILSQSVYRGILDAGQYLTITDPFTGRKIPMPASYFRMVKILYNRQQYGVPTPPAGSKYGSIDETVFEYSYLPTKAQAEDLLRYQINPIVKTPKGETYFVQELTMYKRSSILSRFYVVDTINQIKKDVPELVKDLLMEKATDYIIKQAKERVSRYLNRWTGTSDPRKQALQKFDVKVEYDEYQLTLNIYIKLKFLRTIEFIRIPITVE